MVNRSRYSYYLKDLQKTLDRSGPSTRTVKTTEITCPRCGVSEMHPNGKRILIRKFKVLDRKGNWWSQCLVCAGVYDRKLKLNKTISMHNGKGWFK